MVGRLELIYFNQTVRHWWYTDHIVPSILRNYHLVQTSSCYISGSYVQGAPNERYSHNSQLPKGLWRLLPLDTKALPSGSQAPPSGSLTNLPGRPPHSPENPWAVELSVEYHNRSYSHPTYGPRLSSSATLPKHDYIKRPGVTAMGPSEIRVRKLLQQFMFQFHLVHVPFHNQYKNRASRMELRNTRWSPIYALYNTSVA